jgi:Restriction endonuclease
MPDYDFQTLSSYEFELLSRDLLQEELGVRLESFGKGRDAGVDFRYRDKTGDMVVQCKHYGDYDDLFRVLKRDEMEKVHRLKPARYILTLSTSLTPYRKDRILELFSPYCLATSDIFGREDLNNLLGKHPGVERKHFKLWLTSEAVLTRVLQGAIWGDSSLTLQRIRQRASRYVPNPSFQRAKEILEKHHYCIIAGIPGIGKTTLAEILLIEYVDRHGFQAVRIANDLSEIKAVKNPQLRQIFYFDDFLGTTALDKLQKNEDRRLLELIEEVEANANWRFVLTTREYILNTAKIRYEALAHPPVDLSPCIIGLADYTPRIRARILYNHIFFSDLPTRYKLALLTERRYGRMLRHTNYNPRIVEHMTLARNVTHMTPEAYFDDFLRNLDNPARIWNHAFRNQLNEAAQHVLLVMGSLPDEVLLSDLEVAFNSFYQYRRAKLGFNTNSRDFEQALKALDGNFIKTLLIGRDRLVTFHNPSVSDFLEYYLAETPADVADLIDGAHFYDQFLRLWRGQRGVRFKGIDIHRDKFVSAFENRFSAPTCQIVRVGDGHGIIQGVRRWEKSYESRTQFAIEIANELKSLESQLVVDKLLATLQIRMAEKHGDKEGLVRLLQVLKPTKGALSDAPILVAAKNYLMQGLDDREDYLSLGLFVEKFPHAIREDELIGIRSGFENFCEEYDDSWVSEPDELRNIANDFETVAGQLDVEVGSYCGKLNRRADEWESERIGEDAERDDDDFEDESFGERHESENVEEMFEGLLSELNEKEP